MPNKLAKKITKNEALKIGQGKCAPGYVVDEITAGMPARCNIYGTEAWKAEGVWFVLCSRSPRIGLVPSWAIVISKATGKVLYDDSAGDEG